jgi:hypothetical protein
MMSVHPLSQLRVVQLDPERQIEDVSCLRLNGSNFQRGDFYIVELRLPSFGFVYESIGAG